MNFPKEFEFKKNYENCEHYLEMRLLGWSFKGINNISSAWSIPNLVDQYIKEVRAEDSLCQKPEGGSINMVIAMRKLSPHYGGLYVKFKNMWYLRYKETPHPDYAQ